VRSFISLTILTLPVLPTFSVICQGIYHQCRYCKSTPLLCFLSTYVPWQPLEEVIDYLVTRSHISNLTTTLAKARDISTRPIAHGGLADVYRATMPGGHQYAIKCLRHRNNKELKVCVAPLIADLLCLQLQRSAPLGSSTHGPSSSILTWSSS
jgi:hypothetical protein